MPKITVSRTSNVVIVTDGSRTRMFSCYTVGAADKLEAGFNAEIIRRCRAGETKEQVVAGLGISRELFNRVMRLA